VDPIHVQSRKQLSDFGLGKGKVLCSFLGEYGETKKQTVPPRTFIAW
jgi:hypothetical protein